MKKLMIFVLMVTSIVFIFAEPTDDQIRQSAMLLGVPFEDLRQFVKTYQFREVPSGIIEIKATQLYDEYKTNELRADSQYKGKLLQITGGVTSIEKDGYGYFVSLDNHVRIYPKESELNSIMNLNKGQTITVVGRCDHFWVWVFIQDSYIIRK